MKKVFLIPLLVLVVLAGLFVAAWTTSTRSGIRKTFFIKVFSRGQRNRPFPPPPLRGSSRLPGGIARRVQIVHDQKAHAGDAATSGKGAPDVLLSLFF